MGKKAQCGETFGHLLADERPPHCRNAGDTRGVRSDQTSPNGARRMAQLVASWFICNGKFRVHAINAAGERKRRIIEIEEIATGERTHDSANLMEWLMDRLTGRRGTGGETTTSIRETS